MIKFVTAILICILVIGVPEVKVSASEMDKKTPSGITYSEIGQEIKDYIEIRQEGISACSIAVLDGQNVIYEGYYGYSDLENGIAANENTVYEWGSISKLLVWVSVMQLYEEGRLDFETDISTYLPDGFLTKLKYNDDITMINLMNHNAGWQETTYDIEVKDQSRIVGLEQALHDSEPSQIYRPGEITAYSNWGTALAAFIVEQISGMNYGEYVRDNIFAPLGMNHTSVLADCSDNPWVKEQREKLKCYSITQDNQDDFGDCISYILLYPSGSATGTLGDLATFAKAFTTDSLHCPFFSNPDTLNTMLSASAYYGKLGATSGLERVCHGLWTMEYATQVKGHGGNTSGCSTNFMFDDNSGLTVVVMTNEVGETAFCYGIPELIYGSIYQSGNNSISGTSDIHGIYQSMRTVKKGFLSYCNYTGNLFPIKKTDITGQYRLSIGEGTLTQVTDQIYLFDNGNGMQSIQYMYQNEEGDTFLQQYTSDYKLAKPLLFWFNVIILFLCLIAILLAYICFLIIVVKFAFNNIFHLDLRKKKNDIKVNKDINNIMVKRLKTVNLIAIMIVGMKTMEPEKQLQLMDIIYEKSKRSSELINTMFHYSKLETDRYELNCEPLDICRLTRDIVASQYEMLEEHGIELVVEIIDEELTYPLDKVEYTRAINNLLVNACVHNERGCSVLVRVDKEKDTNSERLLVVVADNGSQIEDKLKDTMFEAFANGDESRSSIGGSGLGLAISKSIVTKHGGNIVFMEPYQNYTKAFVIVFETKIKHARRY